MSGAPNRRKFVLAGLAIVAILGVGLLFFIQSVEKQIRNIYAAEWAGSLVVDYLSQNGDRWPTSWSDLQPVYEQQADRVGRPWSFEELQQRVDIDWMVDADELRRAALDERRPTVIVIRRKDGGTDHFQNWEPNAMVRAYFRDRQAK